MRMDNAFATVEPTATAHESNVYDTEWWGVGDAIHVRVFVGKSVSKRPVLFLHGFGQTGASWEKTAVALAAAGYTSYCPDLRGHGHSQWRLDADYSLDRLIEDVDHMTVRIGEPPILVGASLGGLIAMLMAGEMKPCPFDQLICVDITHTWDRSGVGRILQFMRAHPLGFDSLQHARDTIAAYLPHRPKGKGGSSLEKNLRQDEAGRWRWRWDPRMLEVVPAQSDEFEARIGPALGNLSVPLTLLQGEHSDVVNDEHVAELIDKVPHARHYKIADAAHMVAGDANDLFTTTVLHEINADLTHRKVKLQ